jgi:vitamin B12 transporter
MDGMDVSDPSNPNASFDFGRFLTQDIQRVVAPGCPANVAAGYALAAALAVSLIGKAQR